MSLHRYEAGAHLINQGAPCEYMLIIKQGKVKVNLDDKDIEALALYRDQFQSLMAQHAGLLVKEIHQVLKVHHANDKLEVVEKERLYLDFTLLGNKF